MESEKVKPNSRDGVFWLLGFVLAALIGFSVVHGADRPGLNGKSVASPYRIGSVSDSTFSVGILHTGMGEADVDIRIIDSAELSGRSYTVGFTEQPDKYSASYAGIDEDSDGYTSVRYTLSGSVVLHEGGASIDYDVRLSDYDALSGTPGAIKFVIGPAVRQATYPPTESDLNYTDIPTGPVVKTIPIVPVVVSGTRVGIASGSWSTSDTTEPLTGGIVAELRAHNLYIVVTTDQYPSGEAGELLAFTTYPWYLDCGRTRILSYQQNLGYVKGSAAEDTNYAITDGFRFRIGNVTFQCPIAFTSWNQTVKSNPATPSFTLAGDYTIYSGAGTAHATDIGYGGDSATTYDYQHDLEMRFTGVRVGNTEDTVIVAGGSIATVYSSSFAGSRRIRVPFELWEVEPNGRTRQINIIVRDRNADGRSPWGINGIPEYIRMSSQGRAYIIANSTSYDSSTSDAAITRIGRRNSRNTWVFVPDYMGGNHWDPGDVLHISITNPIMPGVDIYTFTMPQASGLAGDADGTPNEYALSQNYPNPFNPATTIKFSLKNASDVRLRVYDVLGRVVKTIIECRLNAGAYTTTFDASGFATGIYLYRIEAGSFVSVRKMILIK